MSDQPEALRLAEQLKERFGGTVPTSQAAAELRRQHAEIEALKAERDALRADAERYRWLRSLGASWETEAFIAGLTPEQYDAVIDATREAEK